MKIFISWSKEPSKRVAEALAGWLPEVIQSLKPWVSKDIPAGSRWNAEIARELENTKFGIICVTKLNQQEPWLQFEAGALAKTLDTQTYVCPYLIGFGNDQLEQGPLVAFQSVRADKEGTKKLVKEINIALTTSGFEPLSEAGLNKAFDRVWDELEAVLQNLPEQTNANVTTEFATEDMIAEILSTSRETLRKINQLGSITGTDISHAYPSLTIYICGKGEALEDYVRQVGTLVKQAFSGSEQALTDKLEHDR